MNTMSSEWTCNICTCPNGPEDIVCHYCETTKVVSDTVVFTTAEDEVRWVFCEGGAKPDDFKLDLINLMAKANRNNLFKFYAMWPTYADAVSEMKTGIKVLGSASDLQERIGRAWDSKEPYQRHDGPAVRTIDEDGELL